jgi:Na+/melibiose symporter-like transporter
VTGDGSFIFWIVLIAVPIGIVFATFWAGSRGPGEAMLGKPSTEDPRDPL